VTSGGDAPLEALLASEHRRLDDLFGRFLSSATPEDARDAITVFDDALRRHTALEDEHLYSARRGGKLAASEGETDRDRLFRELALEHVQIREVSGMMNRLLGERGDLAGARALAGNLARRWDAHTAREEREAYPLAAEALAEGSAAALREALEPRSG
jgi:hemerythrin-like domain-containing protein